MSRIFKNQDKLRIRLTVGQDITGATLKQIRAVAPSGALKQWTATVETAATGIIYYNFAAADLDETGDWVFYAFITFSDGRSAAGEDVYRRVYEKPS